MYIAATSLPSPPNNIAPRRNRRNRYRLCNYLPLLYATPLLLSLNWCHYSTAVIFYLISGMHTIVTIIIAAIIVTTLWCWRLFFPAFYWILSGTKWTGHTRRASCMRNTFNQRSSSVREIDVYWQEALLGRSRCSREISRGLGKIARRRRARRLAFGRSGFSSIAGEYQRRTVDPGESYPELGN